MILLFSRAKYIILVVFLIIAYRLPAWGRAEEVLDSIQQQINEYNQKLVDLSKSKDTLSNQISYLDSQTKLTQLKIQETQETIVLLEKEINQLSERIDKLDINLNHLSVIFIENVGQNYKLHKKTPPVIFLLTQRLNRFVEEYKYLQTIQKNNQDLLVEMETARTSFDIQKKQKATKQHELALLNTKLTQQQKDLQNQKVAKAKLLEVTKNDEKRYQALKAEAEAELKSLIDARLDKVTNVKKGEIIGIMGNTGYSFGAHLHFGLYELREENVNNWVYENDTDPIPYINSNRFPMDNPEITQARGSTQYAYLYKDRFHHGVDMVSANKLIYAVNDGVAYYYKDKYPNQRVGSGNHVKLFHPDGKMTLYLHME